MMSCSEREAIRLQTLSNLRATDWNENPTLVMDQTSFIRGQERQEQTAFLLLQRAIADASEFILFLEDDLQFNLYLRHNLVNWYPLHRVRSGEYFLGSLYNPNIRELERNQNRAYFVANPECVYGSQAFILSLALARYVVAHWGDVIGMQDIKISRLAAGMCPIYYHTPSLVQHIGYTSIWGGHYHSAQDFVAEWKA